MWARLSATGLAFKHIGRPTCKYRWHGSNISNRAEGLIADQLRILKKMLMTYDLPSICADLDWSLDPHRAGLQACERVIGLLIRKNDSAGAQIWERRQQALQKALVG
jgi:hypothetical protein